MTARDGLAAHLTPLSSRDVDGERARVLGKLEAAGNDLEIVRLLAWSRAVFRPFVKLSDALLVRATLPARLRELMILLLAAETGASYEREQHERMAREAGIDEADLLRLRAGRAAIEQFEGDDRLALEIAAQLHGHGRCERDTWDRAVAAWGAETALEAAATVAWWGGFVPLMLGALGLEADDGA